MDASLLLGLIWAFWHLPQFFIREADTYGQSFFLYVLQVIALSVAIAWLWAKTNGSLLLPMLFHSAVNNSKDIVPSAIPGATNSWTVHGSLVGWLAVRCCGPVQHSSRPRCQSPSCFIPPPRRKKPKIRTGPRIWSSR